MSLLSCVVVLCSEEHPSDLCCVYSTEKLEAGAGGTGSITPASMWHNQPHCLLTRHRLAKVWHGTVVRHHLQQLQSPTGTFKLTGEVSAEVGMNPVALSQAQTAEFALL